MKRNIKKIMAAFTLAATMMISFENQMVSFAEFGPAKGADTGYAITQTVGPSVPAAAGSGTGTGTNTTASAASISPFNTNVYGTPVNGFYCDAVTTYTYENMQADISALQSHFGDIVKSGVLGVTADNRNIYELIVGNPQAENQILLIGSMHGREYITTQLIMRQIHGLLSMAETGGGVNGQGAAALLQSTCIRVVPMNNPDGVTLSQFGIAKVNKQENVANLLAMIEHDKQRENYTGDTDWYFRRWKNNINGVDINRNFSIGWAQLDDSRYFPSYEYFKGPSAESEAETQALIKVLTEADIDEVINYHAQGGVVYWSYGGAADEVEARSLELAKLVKQDTGYILGAASTNKNSVGSGAYKEYLAAKGIPAVTIEVGVGSCPLPESDITGIWGKNQNVLSDLIYEINNR